MVVRLSRVATPDGQFCILEEGGAVLASGWADPEALCELIHPTLRPEAWEETAGSAASRAVERYYAGELTALDEIPVRQHSGPFRMATWEQVRLIPPGEVMSYGDLAHAMGNPRAARATAGACAHNAAALFVPCHRVLAAAGTGGFRYRLEIKEHLLEHEQKFAAL